MQTLRHWLWQNSILVSFHLILTENLQNNNGKENYHFYGIQQFYWKLECHDWIIWNKGGICLWCVNMPFALLIYLHTNWQMHQVELMRLKRSRCILTDSTRSTIALKPFCLFWKKTFNCTRSRWGVCATECAEQKRFAFITSHFLTGVRLMMLSLVTMAMMVMMVTSGTGLRRWWNNKAQNGK